MSFKPLEMGLIKISGRVYISMFALALPILFWIWESTLFMLLFLLSVTLHEVSHILFLHLFHANIKRIVIYPFGVDICADTSKLSYKKEFVCAISGSLANLILSGVGCLFMMHFPNSYLLFFIITNAVLGAFNLLPLPYLDGGNALRLILFDTLSIDKAYHICNAIDALSALAFGALCFLVAKNTSFNLSITAIGIYGTLSYIVKKVLSNKKEKVFSPSPKRL